MTTQISRVDHVRGFGSFRDWECADGLPDFKRYNLIYGWNGSGKTTLSRLLRSIETGLRHEIAHDESMAYGLMLSDGRAVDAESDLQLGSLLRVFNQDYVEDNLRFDEGAQANPLLVLGQERLRLGDEIAAARARDQDLGKQIGDHSAARDRAIAENSERLTVAARAIKQSLSKSATDDYANYNQARLKLALDAMPDGESALLSDVDEKSERVHLNATRLGTIGVPSALDAAAMNEAVLQALSRIAVPVSGSDSIDRIDDADLRGWLAHGVNLHPSDVQVCLFCTSVIPDGRLPELHQRFSGEFMDLVRGLDSSHEVLSAWTPRLEAVRGRIAEIDESNLYEQLRADWNAASGKLDRAVNSLSEGIQAVNRTVAERLENPYEVPDAPISLDSFAASVDAFAESQRSVLGLLQTNIDLAAKIDENRKRAQRRLEGHACCLFRKGYLPRVDDLRDMTTEIQALEKELSGNREIIVELETKASSQAEACEMLNAAISLYFGDGFLTAEPLVVDGDDAGLQLRRSGAVASHLSEGERKGIALAYFFIEISDAIERGESLIVVLDDPVSSLDDNGLFQAESLVRRFGTAATQLFVLTHNFTFFRRVRRWMMSGRRGEESEFLYLTTRDDGGIRTPILRDLPKLLRKHESDYQYLFSVVGAASERLEPVLPEAELAQAPNASRRVLETFLAFRCPNSTDFKGGLTELKKQQSEVFSDVDIDALAAFLDEGSHDRSMDTASASMLASYLDRRRYNDVMRIIERSDREHYAAMIKVCLRSGFVAPQAEDSEASGQ